MIETTHCDNCGRTTVDWTVANDSYLCPACFEDYMCYQEEAYQREQEMEELSEKCGDIARDFAAGEITISQLREAQKGVK